MVKLVFLIDLKVSSWHKKNNIYSLLKIYLLVTKRDGFTSAYLISVPIHMRLTAGTVAQV